jgi:hypothetical protein
MADTYLTPLTHVLPLTIVRRERRLPIPGAVTVRVNQKVQAADVIAEAELTPRHAFLDIARSLAVPRQEIDQHITRKEGDRVEAGEVIAGPVGFARRTVRAPANGRVVRIKEGRVLFAFRGRRLELQAGFPGTVTATDGTSVVSLETTGGLIQAKWGNGRQDFGVMRLIGEGPSSSLQTGQLDINLRGAVLVAGTCDHPAPLHQATELAVRGVILGSISSELIPVTRRLPYPLVVLEGFGRLPINEAAYNVIASNVGREAAIDARPPTPYSTRKPEIIISLPATRESDLPDEVILLESGVRVRVLRRPNQSQVGVVQELLSEVVAYPSGVRARSAVVALETEGPITVPLANLEVLQ